MCWPAESDTGLLLLELMTAVGGLAGEDDTPVGAGGAAGVGAGAEAADDEAPCLFVPWIMCLMG